MSKPTPGPWTWTEQNDTVLPILMGPDGAEVMSFGDDEQYYPTEGCPPEEANARLIAAAPDLLEALKHAVGFAAVAYGHHVDAGNDANAERVEAFIHKCELLIDKAEGK